MNSGEGILMKASHDGPEVHQKVSEYLRALKLGRTGDVKIQIIKMFIVLRLHQHI